MKIKVMLVGYVDSNIIESMTDMDEVRATIDAIYEGDIGIYDLVDEYTVHSVGLEQDTE